MNKKSAESEPVEVISAFKGFDKDMRCRGYQFEIGNTYLHEGTVKACSSGFHSCENPLDVLNYYPLVGDDGSLNKFASVKAFGTISRHSDESKIASASISIEAELKLPEIICAAIKWATAACTTKDASASGNCSKLAASGNYSKLAASGNSSQLAASGNYSQLAASGDSSQLAASGNSSKLAASGDSSQLAASGASSIAASVSVGCIAKAGDLGCIALARWVKSEKRFRMSVGYVGENGIKPDVFYKLNDDGEFIEYTGAA